MNDNIKNINLWSSGIKNNCTFLTTFEEFLAFIEEKNKEFIFTIHDKQYPNQKQKCILDPVADKNNISITYTDKEHPIAILNQFGNIILINPEFFNQNIEKFKEEAKKRTKQKIEEALKNNYLWINIPDYIMDDDFIDYLINSKELRNIDFNLTKITGINLTEEQIKRLKDSHLEIRYEGNKISSKYAIGTYTFSSLETTNLITISPNITEEELNNFIYINKDAKIIIHKPFSLKNEKIYFQKLVKIFQTLETHNRPYNIKIEVENRELLKQSNLLNYTNNINLFIENDFYDYSKDEYLKEDEKLEALIKPIKESNLSPYEKYIAVYNIVKQFKPYKENKEDKEQSRNIRYILNNEYMVCVGYAKLLNILLAKVGIPCRKISVGVDISYDDGFSKEDKPTEIESHARNIVKIDDDKYNIHGIFVADPTWDNDMDNDLYNNSAMSFDRKKEAFRLETLTTEDLLLDFHNIEEFIKKLNFHLNRLIKKSFKIKEKDKIIGAYNDTYDQIMKILYELDYNKYLELYQKYEEKFDKSDITLKELEDILCNFLTEYASYILPLSNQKIDKSTTLEAAINTKREINKHNEEELKELKDKIKSINEKIEEKAFPYSYDPNETRDNYLTETNENKKR
ncbi:MAG: hypothetical protein IJE89_02335 [Bacilli bacterium]|nr:hypothetical protein [Bacilli bacterium]